MLKLSDIASHAGVSPTTVSFVLNDRHEAAGISEKTRLKVLRAAEEMGYRSNHLARAMRTGNSRMLGVLGGRTEEEQVGQLLAGALEAADAQGYTLKFMHLHSMGGSARQVIRRCSELRLMGLMALHLPGPILEELHAEARESATPMVLLDARSDIPDIPHVVSDDLGGVEAGVAHLAQLGHRRIAFICGGGNESTELSSTRKAAFCAAMASHRLQVGPEMLVGGSFRDRAPSVTAATRLLSLAPELRPTAIFCSGDLIAMATLQVAHQLGFQIPRDLSVMGFADLSVAEFASPPLTTVAQPFVEMGRTAADLLLGMIAAREGDARQGDAKGEQKAQPLKAEPQQPSLRVLPTRLVCRESTAPPPS